MGETGTPANARGRPPGEMGAFARLTGVFTSPAKTFESIARWPWKDWILPAALLLAISLIATVVVTPKIDVDRAVERTLQRLEQRTDVPAEQRQQTEEAVRKQFEMGTRGPLRYLGVLAAIVPLLLVPLIYHGIAAAFGKQTTYARVLTGYAYVQGVQMVKSLLFLAVAAGKDKVDLRQVPTLVKSSVGAFLDPDRTPAFLRALATSLDLFEVWALVLGVMALSRVTKLKSGQAAAVVVGLWSVYVLGAAGLAALGAVFGGG